MKIKGYLFFLFIISALGLSSQNETSNWFFGNKVWLQFHNSPVLKSGTKMIGIENCSSISDSFGNLILYSNGGSIYKQDHDTILNGTQLYGDESSSMGSVFVRCPKNDSLIYLFTTDYQGQKNGFCYTIIKMNGNSPIVIKKNIQLVNFTLEPVCATKHANGLDYWITVHSKVGNTFYSFLLTENGIVDCPVMTNIGFNFSGDNIECQSKANFTSNSKYFTISNILNDKCFLLEFDNTNGQFYKYLEIGDFGIPNGMIFSRNNKYLYIAERDMNIYQYEISTQNIQSIYLNKNKFVDFVAGIQLAIDNKIYVNYADDTTLGIISNIDSAYPKVKYTRKGFSIGAPNLRYGLPNFNQSYFNTPAINFKYEMECISNSVKFWGYDTFSASVHQWEVRKSTSGNWQVAGTSKDITYNFTDTGRYEIRYVAAINSRQDTVSKIITLYPKINKQFLGKDTVYASGTPYNRTLKAPYGMHCQLWLDSSGLSTFKADTAGIYICKAINQSFCVVTDTIVIKECINNLTMPSIYRIKDTLYTYQQLADSFVWFRNNQQYKITKEPFIKLIDTGTYRVEAAKKDHCNRSSTTSYINKLGIHSQSLQDIGIKLYPDPSSEKVFIQSETNFKLLVTDITGKVILKTMNVQEVNLPSGIYMFRFSVNQSLIIEQVVVW